MHEKAGDQRGLQHRDDQREADVAGVSQVHSRDSDRDDRADEQRHEDADIDLQMFLDVVSMFVVHKKIYKRYSTGNRKIHTRSTKCQNNPPISTRFVKRTGSVFHIFEPGPQ